MTKKKYHSTFLMELDGEMRLPNLKGGYTSKEMFVLGGLYADDVAKDLGLNSSFYNAKQKIWFVSKSKAKKAKKLGVVGPLENPSKHNRDLKFNIEDVLEYVEEKKAEKETQEETENE